MESEPNECVVVFQRSGVEVTARPGENLLELADRVGIQVPSVCRGGTCGTCRVLLREGEPALETTKALSRKQRRAGWILTCSARATPGRIVLDA